CRVLSSGLHRPFTIHISSSSATALPWPTTLQTNVAFGGMLPPARRKPTSLPGRRFRSP
ncbi:MAG: hypothetical protein AVDCRST_MAG43-1127, partial [uncultured Thermomicrobiales bacterium]